jgi:gamma-glutamyl:cysteine ligase YbdK (ATP-grasp superfamily)
LGRDLDELIRRLLPIAQETGDARFLAALQPVDQFETGADRQRRLYRETGSWKALVDDMAQRLSQELDAAPALPGPVPQAAGGDNRQADT